MIFTISSHTISNWNGPILWGFFFLLPLYRHIWHAHIPSPTFLTALNNFNWGLKKTHTLLHVLVIPNSFSFFPLCTALLFIRFSFWHCDPDFCWCERFVLIFIRCPLLFSRCINSLLILKCLCNNGCSNSCRKSLVPPLLACYSKAFCCRRSCISPFCVSVTAWHCCAWYSWVS